MAHITIVDLPCGYGKSSRIVRKLDKREKYVLVVPYLSEIDRFVEEAERHSGFHLTAPLAGSTNKSDHCEKLIRAGKSIVTTHALFYRLGTLASLSTGVASCQSFQKGTVPRVQIQHLLDDHNLIIDEVIDPVQLDQTVRKVDFDEDYIALGLAEVRDDGRVVPTALWNQKYDQGSKTFSPQLYEKAKSGSLYRMADKLFVLTIPTELLLKPKSVTIYTYLSEGSLLLQFLRKLQTDRPESFTLDIVRIGHSDEAAWREDVANALTVLSIPGLEKQKWNHTAQLRQIKKHSECASNGHKLRRFKDSELYGVNLNTVMFTCARELWHANNTGQKPAAARLAKHARLFGRPIKQEVFNKDTETFEDKWSTTGVRFVPNTTRGTNAHIGCNTAVYLYDQHPNPQLITFFGMPRNSEAAHRFSDAYALTELVQWLFRSAIRVGGLNGTGRAYKPRRRVTLYMPSPRMRNLLLNWVLSGRVDSGPVKPRSQKEAELLARIAGRVEAMAA